MHAAEAVPHTVRPVHKHRVTDHAVGTAHLLHQGDATLWSPTQNTLNAAGHCGLYDAGSQLQLHASSNCIPHWLIKDFIICRVIHRHVLHSCNSGAFGKLVSVLRPFFVLQDPSLTPPQQKSCTRTRVNTQATGGRAWQARPSTRHNPSNTSICSLNSSSGSSSGLQPWVCLTCDAPCR